MKLDYHRNFRKQYEKLDRKTRERFWKQIRIFEKDLFCQSLNNHALKGKYLNCRSINITSDLRAVYRIIDENECIFVEIGTHSELYS